MRISHYIALPFIALLQLSAGSAIAQQYGDEKYQPTVGQHGKDVIWVPTPDDLVVRRKNPDSSRPTVRCKGGWH
jgi:hypothetical protein